MNHTNQLFLIKSKPNNFNFQWNMEMNKKRYTLKDPLNIKGTCLPVSKFSNYTGDSVSDWDKYHTVYGFLAWRCGCPNNLFCNLALKAVPSTDTASTPQ